MNSRSTQPVLITLTGGRSTPAILAALSIQPRAIEFINSQDAPGREEEIRKVLPSEMTQTDRGFVISAHDIQETIDACKKLMQRHTNGPFVIDLSSSPKIMSIAAYEFAKQMSISSYYVDTAGKRIVDLTKQENIPLQTFDVEEYLACFGRTYHAKFNPEALSVPIEDAVKIAKYLVQSNEAGLSVLEKIRINGKGRDEPRTRPIKNYFPSNSEQKVWDYLVNTGLLADYATTTNNFSFTIQRHSDYAFLEGGWLEIYCWNQAQQQYRQSGETIFDDIRLNFEIPSEAHGARKEIDVGLMYSGQLIICSCKAGSSNPWSTEHLDELSAVSSLIGGKFCSRIFITSHYPPNEHASDPFKAFKRFLNQAKDREIMVVTGNEIQDVGGILAQQAIKPTYPRV